MSQAPGSKNDGLGGDGSPMKDRWDLLPFDGLAPIVQVLTYGAKKYAPDGWRAVPDARRRYYGAMLRHLVAWWGGQRLDPESGLPHLGHAGCCLLFLAALEAGAALPEPAAQPPRAGALEGRAGAAPDPGRLIKLGETVVYRTKDGERRTYVVKGFVNIPVGFLGRTTRVVAVSGTTRRFYPRELEPLS